jgi:hypothetical protein
MLAVGYLIIAATAGRDSGEKCNAGKGQTPERERTMEVRRG